MKKLKFLRIGLFALTVFAIAACNNSIPITTKLSPSDPFKNSIVPSQYIGIDTKKDNVVEGDKGTVVVFPKGCFRNAKGDVVEDSVKVEISEALSTEDMLVSNLTTTSNGSPLETDGMIYINATAKGEQLSIDKNTPIHIEIPTAHKKPGMMAYRGIRDSLGNINWVDPQKIDNYLVSVDINSLDFLPDGFKAEVQKGLPFKGHKVATKALVDSLYYSLSNSDGSNLTQGFQSTNYNEPYYNKNKKVVNGKYTTNSYVVGTDTGKRKKDEMPSPIKKGIDPAIIKVIWSEKYQNTLIATREFQARLKAMFKTCDNSVLELYIKNLDKNMYELDSMAAIKLKGTDSYDDFVKFSQQRLTNVKNADKYAGALKGYYEERMKKVNADLQKLQEKATAKLEKKNEEFAKVADDYKKVLLKRESYRMESYGFNWTNTGWVNIDNGTIPKEWGMHPLEVVVGNGKQFDRVYTYVIYETMKSLYRLNSTDKQNFYVGNDQQKQMLMPNNKPAICVAIGYKGDTPYLAVKEFETVAQTNLTLNLEPSTLKAVKEAIKPYEKYESENKISEDLTYMAKMYIEDKRQEELQKESEFIGKLYTIAHPCCKYQSMLIGTWQEDSTISSYVEGANDSNSHWVDDSSEVTNVAIWTFDYGTGTYEGGGPGYDNEGLSTNFDYWLSDEYISTGNTIEQTMANVNRYKTDCGKWIFIKYLNNYEGMGTNDYKIEEISENRMVLITETYIKGEQKTILHKVGKDEYK